MFVFQTESIGDTAERELCVHAPTIKKREHGSECMPPRQAGQLASRARQRTNPRSAQFHRISRQGPKVRHITESEKDLYLKTTPTNSVRLHC